MSKQDDRLHDLLSGELGGQYITGTGANTGDWICIQAITATTFTTLMSTSITGALASITLAAGATLHGKFTAITLASGSVIAYTRPGGRGQ